MVNKKSLDFENGYEAVDSPALDKQEHEKLHINFKIHNLIDRSEGSDAGEASPREVVRFQRLQEDLNAALELVGDEGIVVEKSDGKYLVKFSAEVLDAVGVDSLPFEIVFDPASKKFTSGLISELENNFLAKIRPLEAEEERRAHAEKIEAMNTWYTDMMLSPEWGEVRKNDIKFRHRVETFSKEKKNPYATITRMRGVQGKHVLREFNKTLPAGMSLEMQSPESGKFVTSNGTVDIRFSRMLVPQLKIEEALSDEHKEVLLGMAKCALNSMLTAFDRDLPEYSALINKSEKARRLVASVDLKKSAKKKLDKGEGCVVLARDENGFVSKIKKGVSRAEAESLGGEVLLRNAVIRFPGDSTTNEQATYSEHKYKKLRELLNVTSNKKYLIRRLQNTICKDFAIPNSSAFGEVIHDPKLVNILKEVIDASDFSAEQLANAKTASEFMDAKCGEANWVDALVDDMEKEGYPLLSVQHASTCDVDEL